jgi:hypothetical protein
MSSLALDSLPAFPVQLVASIMKRAGRQNAFLEGPTPGAERLFGKTLKPVEESAYDNFVDSNFSKP